jgi:hypothetical protein
VSKEIKSYKAFNQDMTCRGFQYEVGKTYEIDGDIALCQNGFHACENPLEVFQYYAPARSKFAVVTQSGKIKQEGDAGKIASAKITIDAEINIHQLIEDGVNWILSRAKGKSKQSNSGDRGAASNSGFQGAASNSGFQGAASNSGYRGAASNSGYQGAASNSGYEGAASNSGFQGAASNSGYEGAASNSGYEGAASNSGDRGAASNSGDRGAASNSGYHGAASNSGYQGAASNSGFQGAASNSGYEGAAMDANGTGSVMGIDGSALFMLYRDPRTGEILHTFSGIVGKTKGLKADIWYRLDSKGKPQAVKD